MRLLTALFMILLTALVGCSKSDSSSGKTKSDTNATGDQSQTGDRSQTGDEELLINVAFDNDELYPGRSVIYCPKLTAADGKPKLLTRDGIWKSNAADDQNTKRQGALVFADDFPFPFGGLTPPPPVPLSGVAKDRGWRTVWNHQGLDISRDMQIVRGSSGKLDTVQISYLIENKDSATQKVGLRELINTHCGDSDAAPFLTSNGGAPIADLKEFKKGQIPEVVRRFEGKQDDPKGASNELRVRLKGFEEPEKLVVCQMPFGLRGGPPEPVWKYEPISTNPRKKDSCVVIYWAERDMKPGEKRKCGYTYGLAKP